MTAVLRSTQATATEAQEQEALFDFLNRIAGRVPAVRWAFHPPNGGARPRRQDAKGRWFSTAGQALQRQGAKPGVPDVWLPVRRGEYVGFVCELKVGKNTTSSDQREWLAHLKAQGWIAIVCWHWEDAARALLTYLGQMPEDYGL